MTDAFWRRFEFLWVLFYSLLVLLFVDFLWPHSVFAVCFVCSACQNVQHLFVLPHFYNPLVILIVNFLEVFSKVFEGKTSRHEITCSELSGF